MNKYKNAILHYNPRSYLDMRKNSVNSEIVDTLKESENNEVQSAATMAKGTHIIYSLLAAMTSRRISLL